MDHLLPACPDDWENMAKINIVEDEYAVLFTGYNKEEVRRLDVDAWQLRSSRQCVQQ